mmetsp:Transcript_11900/g.32745  ORF Transcript_11900/g.32745 Transcript_11900/m.32745 type:complete len:233 (-) Transcript_11900:13-711(-)
MSVVPPPLEYMSKLHTQNQEISGRQVWCGSMLLANYLHEEMEKAKRNGGDGLVLDGKNILELGCGTGLLGMAISKMTTAAEPTRIVLTDGDDLAITLLRQNFEHNAIDTPTTRARKLLWGKENAVTFEEWYATQFGKVELFEYIVAGDVLYKETLLPIFFESVDRFLRPDGVLYLCHIPRAGVDQERVQAYVKDVAGLHLEEIPSSHLEAKDVAEEDRKRARIYKITRLVKL